MTLNPRYVQGQGECRGRNADFSNVFLEIDGKPVCARRGFFRGCGLFPAAKEKGPTDSAEGDRPPGLFRFHVPEFQRSRFSRVRTWNREPGTWNLLLLPEVRQPAPERVRRVRPVVVPNHHHRRGRRGAGRERQRSHVEVVHRVTVVPVDHPGAEVLRDVIHHVHRSTIQLVVHVRQGHVRCRHDRTGAHAVEVIRIGVAVAVGHLHVGLRHDLQHVGRDIDRVSEVGAVVPPVRERIEEGGWISAVDVGGVA